MPGHGVPNAPSAFTWTSGKRLNGDSDGGEVVARDDLGQDSITQRDANAIYVPGDVGAIDPGWFVIDVLFGLGRIELSQEFADYTLHTSGRRPLF
ncbi:hypothetical protein QMG61_08370 [Cryobacterium sp. PH31-AA6]|uniref:hypothetical protein n=1 Tax=Cryobacterium sp. PH31-AA6 TaxID=3046205 RepID=UPI0024BBA589|nr:hypothetical protein [Cryobacterium sp. PH31-AA6]MDJ0323774.1 hypothetical protein [Cryobacterium sp. PH31-AA6]